MADYTFLDLIPAYRLEEHSANGWSELLWNAKPLLNPAGKVSMNHVAFSLIVLAMTVVLALVARKAYTKSLQSKLIPEGKLSVRNFFEAIFDGLFDLMEGMMGKKYARQFFPLIGSLGVYILLSNLIGLVPGLYSPTANLNTNLACGLFVFVYYNYLGLRENGMDYIRHFMGPMLALAWFILPIELVGHVFRPLSLAIRLAGNLTGDHEVLNAFGLLGELLMKAPLIFPIPFLFLGLLVSVVQTVVFCMLSSIYIALAVHHEEH